MDSSDTDLPSRPYPGREATRDPIFLLQKRVLRWRSEDSLPDGYSYGDDGLVFRDEDFYEERPWLERDDARYPETWSCRRFADSEMNDGDAVLEEWEPIGEAAVWFTREEAEAWAKAHEYRWPSGWRVYCACAAGELAKLLQATTVSIRPSKVRP